MVCCFSIVWLVLFCSFNGLPASKRVLLNAIGTEVCFSTAGFLESIETYAVLIESMGLSLKPILG